MHIAFVQLGSYGDNVNSTLMFKPIKAAYPNCNLEVHTTDLYASAFHNNPHISRLITYPAFSKTDCFNLYNTVPVTVKAQRYDKVFVPAPILHPNRRDSLLHPEFGQNIITTFMRVLEDAGIPYDWPVETILNLKAHEISNVDHYLVDRKIILGNKRNILMEVHGESGQTYWNPHWTLAVGRHLMTRQSNLFISRRDYTQEITQLEREFPGRVYYAGSLTIRECAELYNRCSLFMSISSGLSNACGTSHCHKPDGTNRRWVETVNSPTVNSAPVHASGKIFWYANDLNDFIKMLQDNDI